MFIGAMLHIFVMFYNRMYHKTGNIIYFNIGDKYYLELNVTNIKVVEKQKNNIVL
jgi:hypothetical protein